MYWRSELNGIVASRGSSSATPSVSRPALAATTSIAASVGSPTMSHRPSCSVRAASLQAAPISNVQRSAGWESRRRRPAVVEQGALRGIARSR